jgi:hypothetical protein
MAMAADKKLLKIGDLESGLSELGISHKFSLERNASGADQLVEKHDETWTCLGVSIVVLLTVAAPAASVFGLPAVLWVWWAAIAFVLLSFLGMVHTNKTIGSAKQSTKFLIVLLIIVLKYPITGTGGSTISANTLSMGMSIFQLVVLFALRFTRKYGMWCVVGIAWCILELTADIASANGTKTIGSMAKVNFISAVVLSCTVYLFSSDKLAHIVMDLDYNLQIKLRADRSQRDGDSQIVETSQDKEKAVTQARLRYGYQRTVRWLQRTLVPLVFFRYAVWSEGIHEHQCDSNAWEQWGGWVGLLTIYLLLSCERPADRASLDLPTSSKWAAGVRVPDSVVFLVGHTLFCRFSSHTLLCLQYFFWVK